MFYFIFIIITVAVRRSRSGNGRRLVDVVGVVGAVGEGQWIGVERGGVQGQGVQWCRVQRQRQRLHVVDGVHGAVHLRSNEHRSYLNVAFHVSLEGGGDAPIEGSHPE